MPHAAFLNRRLAAGLVLSSPLAVALGCSANSGFQEPDVDTFIIQMVPPTGGAATGGDQTAATGGSSFGVGGTPAVGGTPGVGGGLATGGAATGGGASGGAASGGAGSGGEGSGGADPGIPPGTTYPLSLSDAGAVSEDTFSVVGHSYGFSDCDDMPQPDPCSTQAFSSPVGKLCANGTAAIETTGVYGAGVGFTLNSESEWDADAAGVVGIKFSVSGSNPPDELRVSVGATGLPGDGPYFGVSGATEHTVYFSQLDYRPGATDRPLVDPSKLTGIQFQVPAGESSQAFDYCVESIELIYGGGSVGGVPLTPNDDGYVSTTSNTLGYSAAYWTYGDDASTINPAPGENVFTSKVSDGEVCVSGSVAVWAKDGDFGVGLGTSFNSSAGFNASTDEVLGFRFELVNNGSGPTDLFSLADDRRGLEFSYGSGTSTDSVVQLLEPGQHVVLFDDERLDNPVTTSQIRDLKWQASSDGDGAKSFDFCIRNVEAIVDN